MPGGTITDTNIATKPNYGNALYETDYGRAWYGTPTLTPNAANRIPVVHGETIGGYSDGPLYGHAAAQ
jgi:hypothetical protein